MRKLIILMLATLALSSPAFSQATQPQLSEEKIALYTKYYDLKKGGADGQKVAYEVAKEYLQKFGADDDQYTQAVRKFVSLYERATLDVNFYKAYNAKEYSKVFEVGRQILNTEPDNFKIMGLMIRAGYLNSYSGYNSLNAEGATLAKRAIQLVDSGSLTKPDPFTSLDDARGFINFALGFFLRESAPVDAAAVFYKAAQSGSMKEDPATYYYLARATLDGDYEKISAEYKQKYGGQPESPEQKAMYEQVIKIADRAIDAYARAVALSTKPDQQKFKNLAMGELREIYKDFHNGSDTGLNDLIASVLSKPLPD
jgi:hypothetical protein